MLLAFVLTLSTALADDTTMAAAQMAQDCQTALARLNSTGKGQTCHKEQNGGYPTTEVETSNGQKTQISVVPEQDLQKLFYFSTTFGLPLKNRHLCSQRAHVVAYELKDQKNILAGKLIATPKSGMLSHGQLNVQYPDGRNYLLKYHVAPFVAVEREGKIEQWVIDPFTFSRPVKREEWESFLKNRAETYVTDRFALDDRDKDRTDLKGYTVDPNGTNRTIGHTWQVIERMRGQR
ncbi:MAG: hypothetical protein KF799_14720 [Bdellovibrionales bacterium]|nr:hypothetical protein [Bdellovibrionales bacterium]